MRVSAATIENGEKNVMKIVRNFNAGILKFIMGIRFRAMGATILGSFAGLSLTSNIIPSALSWMGYLDSFSARWGLGGFAVYSMMAWGVGGWAVQKTGDKKPGAIVLGGVGLLSGVIFTGIGLSTEIHILLAAGGAGLLYGAIGGMIIGDALRNPAPSPGNREYEPGTIGSLPLFGYLRKVE